MARLTDLTEGLQILGKYVETDAHIGGAEHDIIYVTPFDVEVTPEHRARLEELGFHFDEEHGWCRFC